MRNQETDSQHAKEAGDGACDPTMCLPGGRLERRGGADNRLTHPTALLARVIRRCACLEDGWSGAAVRTTGSPCLDPPPPEQETTPASEETDASASGSAERADARAAPGRQPLHAHLLQEPYARRRNRVLRPAPRSNQRRTVAGAAVTSSRGVDGVPDQGWTVFHLPSAPGGRSSR